METRENSISSQAEDEQKEKRQRHQIYRYRVTWGIIIACCGVFIGGIWISGIQIYDPRGRSLFDTEKHICVQESWLSTTRGEKARIKFCTEWIDMADQSGVTQVMALEKLEIFMDSDGKIRAHLKQGINYGLVTAFVYLIVIIIGGRKAQDFLFHRHRRQMGLQI